MATGKGKKISETHEAIEVFYVVSYIRNMYVLNNGRGFLRAYVISTKGSDTR